MESSQKQYRCVNLDWLEVHTREPLGYQLNADYFRSKGYFVHERDYGTRIYREMFVIDGEDGMPRFEIRRNPASPVHDEKECHIRLTNRTCYFDNAAELLSIFLEQHGYTCTRISRIDLCLDFVKFDLGDNPNDFIRRYFKHRYAKINQGNIHAHGSDTWSGQEWNSISWGAKTSAISTKLYDKTMELYDLKTDSFGKPWIRQAWTICGMIDDWTRCTKNNELVHVYRLEFSIRSAVKNWVPINLNGNDKKIQSLKNTLSIYHNRKQILVMFASLTQHYFRFKVWDANIRKDRCKDKILFVWNGMQTVYKVGRNDYTAGNNEPAWEPLQRLINKIKQYRQTHFDKDVQKACTIIIDSMEKENAQRDLANPYSKEELEYMQMVIKLRIENPDMSVEFCMKEARDFMNLKKCTLDVF